MSSEDEAASTTEPEYRVLTQILEALQKLDQEGRERILSTVATFFGLTPKAPLRRNVIQVETPESPSFSDDRSISPKQFLLDKQPKTDVEKVACLAYYLTHYRDTPHFRTLDISKLNTEAAQIKFSNAAVAVDNATKQSYLVSAVRGTKQLSAQGEQFVFALPDRDRAKAAMANARPRRKSRRSSAAPETLESAGT